MSELKMDDMLLYLLLFVVVFYFMKGSLCNNVEGLQDHCSDDSFDKAAEKVVIIKNSNKRQDRWKAADELFDLYIQACREYQYLAKKRIH